MCVCVGGHVFKRLWTLAVTGRSNMCVLNMCWQPYEPLGCRVAGERRSGRERRWEAWPCSRFSQWSNHSYSSECAAQTGSYQRGCTRSCFFFFFFYPFISSVCQFQTFFFPPSLCLLVCLLFSGVELAGAVRQQKVCVCVCVCGFSSDSEAVLTIFFTPWTGEGFKCLQYLMIPPSLICKFDYNPPHNARLLFVLCN